MATNPNFYGALRGNGGYYTAQSAGPFNTLSASGGFAAFSTFIVRGRYQQFVPPIGTIIEQFIWGNEDDVAGAGWSFRIESIDGSPALSARIYDGAGVLNFASFGLGGFVEHIIQAALWFDSENILLSINGHIVSSVALATPGYTPSGRAARLLADPVAAATLGAYIDLNSCGFSPVDLGGSAGTLAGTAGYYAASSFRGSYAGPDGLLDPDAGLDWLHRYSADNAAQNIAGTITRTPAGAYLAALAAAPATINDVGDSGPVSAGAFVETALTRTGSPVLFGRKLVPFFSPAAAVSGSAPQPSVAVVDLYVSPALGDDNNPGTQAAPLATLEAAEARIPNPVLQPYQVHLRAETYPLPDNDQRTFIRTRTIEPPGSILIFADEAWDPNVYTQQLADVAAAGTTTDVITVAGPLVVDAFQGMSVRFTSGPAAGQYRRVNTNDATTISLSYSLSAAPNPGDTFEIFTFATILSVPAAPASFYNLVWNALGGPPSLFTFPLTDDLIAGVMLRGLALDCRNSIESIVPNSNLFIDGVDVQGFLTFRSAYLWASFLRDEEFAGWGCYTPPGSRLSFYGGSYFAGSASGHEFLFFEDSTGWWQSGRFFRLLGSLSGISSVYMSATPPSTVPALIDSSGTGSVAVRIYLPSTSLIIDLVQVLGGGGGIQAYGGAVIELTGSCIGDGGSGNAVEARGTGHIICTAAPNYGGAGTDWLVEGAAAFNKAALAAVGSAVVGTDGSVATHSAV